mgnify:CR=1 FL=1
MIIDEPALVKSLEELKRRVPTGPLVPMSSKDLRRWWEKAAKALQLERSLGIPHLYVLRHSGASADMRQRRRSLDEIKRRGRWRADGSLRRYEKGGRAQERLSALSTPILEYVLKCARRVWQVLARRSQPLSLPKLSTR